MKRSNVFPSSISLWGILILILFILVSGGLSSNAFAAQVSKPHGTLSGSLSLPSGYSWSATNSGDKWQEIFGDKYGVGASVTIGGGLTGNVSVGIKGQGNIEGSEIPGSGNLWFSGSTHKVYGIPIPVPVRSSAAMNYKAEIWSSFTITIWIAGNEHKFVQSGPSKEIDLTATQSFSSGSSPYLLGGSVSLSASKTEELGDIHVPVPMVPGLSVKIGGEVKGEARNDVKGETLTTSQGDFTSAGEKKTIYLTGGAFTVNDISERLESTASVSLTPVATLGVTIGIPDTFFSKDFDLEIKLGTKTVVDNHVEEFTANPQNQNLTFSILTNTLAVSKVGDGSIFVIKEDYCKGCGFITTSPSLPWTGQFITGSSVTLNAEPRSGYDFSSWSGDLSGAANLRGILINGDKKVTANFKNKLYTLSLSKTGNGKIKVNGNTAVLPWTGQFPSWTNVTIEAVPDLDWGFSAWTGDLLGNIPSTTIPMSGPKSITAQYFQEAVTNPTTPTGPTQGIQGSIYSFTTGGASSNLSHAVQYRIDFGDNTNSGWLQVGQTTISKAWASAGPFAVKAMARCVNGTVQSGWSDSLSVTILNTTAGTTTNPFAFGYPFQRKGFYAHSLYWLFYSDGAQMVYKTSSDGLTWGSPTVVRACNSGEQFSIWFDKTYVHYGYANGVAGTPIWYRRGMPDPSGSITWPTGEQMAVPGLPWVIGKTYSLPCIAVDSNGYPWIGYRQVEGTNKSPMIAKSARNDGHWQAAVGFPGDLAGWTAAAWVVAPVPLSNGKMLAIYTSSGHLIRSKTWTGSSWTQRIQNPTPGIGVSSPSFSVVAHGDEAHFVFLSSTSLMHSRYSYSANSWGKEVKVHAGSLTPTSAPALAADPQGDLHLFWAGSPKIDHIYYKRYSGGKWDLNATDWIDESVEKLTRNDALTSFYQAEPNRGVGYLTRKPSPYKVKFNRGY